MWSHYAEKHKGIVIGFDPTGCYGVRQVKYSTKRVMIPLPSTYREPSLLKDIACDLMTTKSSDWKYEKEWRRIVSCSELKKTKNFYLVNFPKEAVTSIILGNNVDPSLKKAVLSSIYMFPNCKLFQAELHPSEFKIEMRHVICDMEKCMSS